MWDYSFDVNINAIENLYAFADILIFMEILQSKEMYLKKVHA